MKGEFWAPLWKRPMTVPELRRVIAEGRVSWRGKQAAHGLDAAKALSTLGVDRGLSRFERYVIADRFGRSPLAVPAGSFTVARHPADHVSLLSATDTWLDRVRRQALPNAAASALRRVEAAQMDVAQNLDSRTDLQISWLSSLLWNGSSAATRNAPQRSGLYRVWTGNDGDLSLMMAARSGGSPPCWRRNTTRTEDPPAFSSGR